MLTLPKSLKVDRNTKAESKLVKRVKDWLERDSKDRKGIHASDLLDPRKAYYDKTNPQPMTARMVGLFFVGKVLHSFLLSALLGEKGTNWKSDGGSTIDKELGISYSPDWKKLWKGVNIPGEFKTNRSKYEQSTSDLKSYLEQELIYQVGEQSEDGRLITLMLNLPAPRGEGWGTYPQFRCYDVSVDKSGLKEYRAQLIKFRKLLERALKTKKKADINKLPLCRDYKCGRSQCPHYNDCKPEGRFGLRKWDK